MNRDMLLVVVFAVLTLILIAMPTGFEERLSENSRQAKGRVLEVDSSELRQFGIVKAGFQTLEVAVLDGPFAGKTYTVHNEVLGQLDRDSVYAPGDTALVVLTLDEAGQVVGVTAQSHYRIDLELTLLGLLAAALVVFCGWTGVKALLSFIFSLMMIWKIMVPRMLMGDDPVLLSLGVVALLTASIIFLVAGISRKGMVAFAGAFLGVLTSCLLAEYFVGRFHLHGAVMPFAETLLYSGYAHLDLRRIFVAAVFLASSGAVMDLAMDVAASMDEVVRRRPDITRLEALASGFRVGRAVVGTMTTTLLLAYSGGYVTLLMAFMAQGVPIMNTFNLVYVAAEVLKTLVGSFGLVMVAPFTAVVGSVLLVKK